MWVRLDDSFSTHPKVTRVNAAARWTYIVALCHCGRHLTDGVLDEGFIRSVPAGHLIALCATGLWERDDDTYRIHDYLDYNPTRAEVEAERDARRKQRRDAGRARAASAGRSAGGQFTSESPTGDQRTAGESGGRQVPAPSRPSPSPSPYGSQGSTDSPPEHSSPSLGPPPSANGRERLSAEQRGARVALKNVLVEVCGWDTKSMTRDAWGEVERTAKQLHEASARPPLVRGFLQQWEATYPEAGPLRPQTVASHWPEYMGGSLKREERPRARRY